MRWFRRTCWGMQSWGGKGSRGKGGEGKIELSKAGGVGRRRRRG